MAQVSAITIGRGFIVYLRGLLELGTVLFWLVLNC
jgi:hypothetical protein